MTLQIFPQILRLTNSSTFPVAPPLPACDIKTPFYSVFFEDEGIFFVTSIQRNVNIAGWGHPSSHPEVGPADVIRDNNSAGRPPSSVITDQTQK